MLTDSAKAWLKDRGLDADVAATHGLVSEQANTGEWIALPFAREGRIVNTKYRRLDQKDHRQDKGGVRCVWNEDALREPEFTGPVIITEGEWDALSAIQCGFERTVSVPAGAPAQQAGERDTPAYGYVSDLLDLLRDEDEIIIAADDDQPGYNLLADLAARLGKARCKFLRYPKGCKDLNDALQRYGERGVKETIGRAQFIEVPGVHKLSDLPAAPELRVFRAGLSEKFDEHVGICPGHFSVWTGIPNHGKSALLKAVAIELAKRQGWKTAIAAFEDEITTDFRRDVAKYIAARPHRQLTETDWREADEFIEQHFLFVVPDWTDEVTLDFMLEKMEVAVRREGAKLVIIDPWTELDHEFGQLSETQYTSICIKQFRRFARRFDCHVAMVAHPAKIAANNDGTFRVPTGYDISGSAHWNNKPELGVTVHRDYDKGEDVTLVKVWKSKRHDVMGKTGEVRFHFDWQTGRYSPFYDMEDFKDANAA